MTAPCSRCGEATEYIDRLCQRCLEAIVFETRTAQGLAPTVTDPAVLANVSALFACADDPGGAAIGTPVGAGGVSLRLQESGQGEGVSKQALASVPPTIDTSRHPSGWKGETEEKATTPPDTTDEAVFMPTAG